MCSIAGQGTMDPSQGTMDPLRQLIRMNFISRILRFNKKLHYYEQWKQDMKAVRWYNPLTVHLKKCFYKNNGARRWGGGKSSKKIGTAFHQLVYHDVMCRDGCDCEGVFGARPSPSPPRKGSKLSLALQQRANFIANNNLKPLVSELIITSEKCGIGTQVDEIALQTVAQQPGQTKKQLWLISWKTGYAENLQNACGRRKFMAGKNMRKINCTDENQHLMQLLAEKKILNELDVKPTVCVVVYVLRNKQPDGYFTRFLHKSKVFNKEIRTHFWNRFSEYCSTELKYKLRNGSNNNNVNKNGNNPNVILID